MGFFTSSHHLAKRGNSAVPTMLEKGQDPKDMMIEVCRPSCTHWEERLKRCEIKLQTMEHADPEMSCMYPLRDWVTCIDSCVNPKIQSQLVGQEPGFFS